MDGVFSFLKPPGITSHDAVGICRRLLKEKRIGHSGTLDPLAYGVLPIFVGKATRLIEYTENHRKIYVAEARFGIATDTEDSTGNMIAENSLVVPTYEEVVAAIASFIGLQEQVPSMYSAIKVNGKRAYELAREGKEFTLPSREIEIFHIELLAYAYPYMTFRVECSSGTYIRALIRDIAHKLGTVAMMTQLARTAVGDMSIHMSYTAEEVESLGEAVLSPMDSVLHHLPIISFAREEAIALGQGKLLPYDNHLQIPDQGLGRAYYESQFLGIIKRNRYKWRVEKNISVELG